MKTRLQEELVCVKAPAGLRSPFFLHLFYEHFNRLWQLTDGGFSIYVKEIRE